MPVWQSEDVREADEAVLGAATTEISAHLFLTPIAAIEHWAGLNPQANCLSSENMVLSYDEVSQLTLTLGSHFGKDMAFVLMLVLIARSRLFEAFCSSTMYFSFWHFCSPM